jgi:predicted N-acyltransferase
VGDRETAFARVVPRIADIDAAAWDRCANSEPASFNPVLAYGFLKALEDAGTVGPGTGWMPHHLAIEEPNGSVSAVMPLYLKTHSQGEYVFDYAWAEAFHRAGGRYYPKLQSAIPFTPVPGRRLLVRPGSGEEERTKQLAQAAVMLAKRAGASSLHVTFLSQAEWHLLGRLGFLKRTDQQFHWQNPGCATFEDFLASLTSRRRKAIRRERSEIAAAGIEIELLTGSDITEAHWDQFFAFYMDTGSRKWGRPYLNRRLF